MNKLTLILFAVIALSWVQAQDDVDSEFENFKAKFNKKYGSPEEAARRKRIFASTNAKIKAHNNKNGEFEMGHNQFSDMTPQEKNKYLGADASLARRDRQITHFPTVEDRQLPTAYDLRNDSCLSAVKDQGSCGSCWAFTAIASFEYSRCKKSGSRTLFSEQQAVDCDPQSFGCDGGWYDWAWDYMKAGAATSAMYPYASGSTGLTGTCKFTTSMTAAKVSTMGYIAQRSVSGIRNALINYGPVGVALNVVDSFFPYKTGVYSDSTCTRSDGYINHAVNIVGYGNQNGVNHWIVRNSWGFRWGSDGYFLIQRGVNMCNIELYGAFAAAA